jgi:hypothetical protein
MTKARVWRHREPAGRRDPSMVADVRRTKARVWRHREPAGWRDPSMVADVRGQMNARQTGVVTTPLLVSR